MSCEVNMILQHIKMVVRNPLVIGSLKLLYSVFTCCVDVNPRWIFQWLDHQRHARLGRWWLLLSLARGDCSQ